eukprot:TRINITY_DN997_c0_g1_i2.p1 TRINITY_DN997_c0_g1~~TRINITY_DN997_c0_g1_i2.p1  ORF type:complete len:252 (+),score=54.53 TRINITY_DN997_c0_g1_i2:303-1058(+)
MCCSPVSLLSRLSTTNPPARGDAEKATEVTIAIKNDIFEKAGDQYELDKYEGYRTATNFSQKKMFGKVCLHSLSLALSLYLCCTLTHSVHHHHHLALQEALKASMKVWTKSPIPTSLTRLAPGPLGAQLATKMFKNILGFMGDRKYNYPAALLHEIIDTCIGNRAMRDEVYCQLLKQLTNNPNPESLNRGWKALRACINYFAPTHGFANFLEVYLRNYKPAFVDDLHKTLYAEREPTTPPLETLTAQLQGW